MEGQKEEVLSSSYASDLQLDLGPTNWGHQKVQYYQKLF